MRKVATYLPANRAKHINLLFMKILGGDSVIWQAVRQLRFRTAIFAIERTEVYQNTGQNMCCLLFIYNANYNGNSSTFLDM